MLGEGETASKRSARAERPAVSFCQNTFFVTLSVQRRLLCRAFCVRKAVARVWSNDKEQGKVIRPPDGASFSLTHNNTRSLLAILPSLLPFLPLAHASPLRIGPRAHEASLPPAHLSVKDSPSGLY